MRRRTSIIAMALQAWCLLSEGTLGFCQTSERTSAQVAQEERIDSYITQQMRARRIPGAAVAVTKHGKIILNRAYGTANLETGTPVDANSVFELASVTKPFTATAIMLLAQDGKLRLDDPITEYIDHAPESWKTRTIRHLLSHTSGFPVGGIVTHDGSPLLKISTKQVFDYLSRTPLRFEAGERSSYSDGGYFLLGMIIERASGESYRSFLKRRIFDPLGMTDSRVMDRLEIVKHHVPVYAVRDGELVHWGRDWQYELPSFFGMLSTAADLAKFDLALTNGTLIERSRLQAMWTPTRLSTGEEIQQGLGWQLGQDRGHRFVSHAGASGTLFMRYVDDGLSVIVLTNLGIPSDNSTGVLARGIVGLMNPALLPPDLMTPQPDPAPRTTEAFRDALRAVAEGEKPAILLPGAASPVIDIPQPMKNRVINWLKALREFTYLASHPAGGQTRKVRGYAVARTVFCRSEAEGTKLYFIFELTPDDKVAQIQFYFEPPR